MQFQNPPTALNRIIFAVIRRVIEQLDGLADGIDQLHHAMEKLRAHAAALRAVVHFELHPLNRALLLHGEPVPPSCERIDEEVTGLGGTAKGHRELGGVFIEDPTRNIVFRAPKVMVTRFVLTARFSPARERPKLDRGFTVHAQPFDPGGSWLAWSFFEIGKNRIGFWDLFLRLRFDDFAQAIAHAV